jgi:LPS export ABC transporter protein LptC
MNKIFRLIIFIPFFILGCKPNVVKENKTTQKIESLTMNIFSKSGDKLYSISSPNSIYNNSELRFELEKPTINIYNGNETKYIIKSDESILSNNNNLLRLKGNVKLKILEQVEDFLYADNFIWNIKDDNYLLEGNIVFENKNIILNSAKAKLNSDNIIEFFNPVKYTIKDDNNKNKYEINSENAYYNLKTESVSFKAKDKRVRSIIYF